MNATQAAIRAGYSPKTAMQIGYENLRKPDIAAAIQEAQQQAQERNQVTVDTVVTGLIHEARTAKSDSVRVQAWTVLGRHLGMFTERVEVPGRIEHLAAVATLSADQVAALAAQAVPALPSGSTEG